MNTTPRHVICVLGKWRDWSDVEVAFQSSSYEFTLDRDYSQLSPDDRMPRAFETSVDRFHSSMTDRDWKSIRSHTAVAYVLSPPLVAKDAQNLSAQSLLLTAELLKHGGVAAKSESAGLAHGRTHWIELARKYMLNESNDEHTAASTLYWAWVQRIIHDESNSTFYSCGMHLLGQRDTEVEDSLDPSVALQWIDLLGLDLVADRPLHPVANGEEFRLSDEGPRRVASQVECSRYVEDDFLFNPYGYNRLLPD